MRGTVAAQGLGKPLNAEERVEVFLRKYIAGTSLGPDETPEYSLGFIDLNNDRISEAIVYLIGRPWCGSGGCKTLILAQAGSSYRVIGRTSTTRPPIRVLKSRTNGWRDISAWVQGGGIQPGYEIILPFNGGMYPRFPNMPPARRLRTHVDGDVVIPLNPETRSLRQ